MRLLVILSLIISIAVGCKSSKTHCDAYSKVEIKKDHQI